MHTHAHTHTMTTGHRGVARESVGLGRDKGRSCKRHRRCRSSGAAALALWAAYSRIMTDHTHHTYLPTQPADLSFTPHYRTHARMQRACELGVFFLARDTGGGEAKWGRRGRVEAFSLSLLASAMSLETQPFNSIYLSATAG